MTTCFTLSNFDRSDLGDISEKVNNYRRRTVDTAQRVPCPALSFIVRGILSDQQAIDATIRCVCLLYKDLLLLNVHPSS